MRFREREKKIYFCLLVSCESVIQGWNESKQNIFLQQQQNIAIKHTNITTTLICRFNRFQIDSFKYNIVFFVVV